MNTSDIFIIVQSILHVSVPWWVAVIMISTIELILFLCFHHACDEHDEREDML